MRNPYALTFRMNLEVFIFIAILFNGFFVSSQNVGFNWVRSFQNSMGFSRVSHAVDGNGNAVLAGRFGGMVDFDPGPGVYTLTSFGDHDIFVCKLDPNGAFLWARQIGGTGSEDCASVKCDAFGNIIFAGYFSTGTPDFDPGVGTFTLGSLGGYDIFLSKLDPAGNFLWVKQIASSGMENVFSIATDALGNIFATGYVTGTSVDFDPGPPTFTIPPFGNMDIFVLKLNGGGNFVWAKRMGGQGDDFSATIFVDNLGNCYTSGEFDTSCDFDPGPLTYTLNPVGIRDAFVSKLDGLGNFVWARKIGGLSYEGGSSITIDGLGNVIVTGYFMGTVDFDPGISTYTLASSGSNDIFVEKLDSFGNFIWASKIGSSGGDGSSSVVTDLAGNVYLQGSFSAAADLDLGLANYPLNSNGLSDIFIQRLDLNGNMVWNKHIGGSQIDSPCGLSIDASGSIHSSGIFMSPIVDFNPGPGTTTLSAFNSSVLSIYISKFSTCVSPIMPANNSSSSAMNFCAGLSTTLSAAHTGTLHWYNTTNSIIGVGSTFLTPPLSVGNFTYYAESDSLCSSLQRAVFIVTVNPVPSIIIAGPAAYCIGGSASQTLSGAANYTWNFGSNATLVVLNPTVTTSYTVSSINGFGCVGSSTKTITVYPLPTISISGPNRVCKGKPIVQIVAGVASFTWYSGVGSPTPSALSNTILLNPPVQTNYTISAHDINGCYNTTIKTVSVFTNPIVYVSNTKNTFCAEETVTLNVQGAESYVWSNGFGDSSIVLEPPLVQTTFTVTGTTNSCSTSNYFSIYLVDCTDISFNAANADPITLFPNPNEGFVTIRGFGEGSVEVYNSMGELVVFGKHVNDLQKLDLRDKAPGFYFVKFLLRGRVIGEQKIIKKE